MSSRLSNAGSRSNYNKNGTCEKGRLLLIHSDSLSWFSCKSRFRSYDAEHRMFCSHMPIMILKAPRKYNCWSHLRCQNSEHHSLHGAIGTRRSSKRPAITAPEAEHDAPVDFWYWQRSCSRTIFYLFVVTWTIGKPRGFVQRDEVHPKEIITFMWWWRLPF